FWGNGQHVNDVYLDGVGSSLEISHTFLNDFSLTDPGKDQGILPTYYGGNILAMIQINNPKFIDTACNWRLRRGSELIDVGTNTFGTPNAVPQKDCDDGIRTQGGIVDIGADEWGDGTNYEHPRIFMSPEMREKLEQKVANNDPDWIKLKNQADILKNQSITPFKYATAWNWYGGTIQYGYQGGEWFEAALPLCFAYQLTGDTSYSSKAVALAQEMVRAMHDSDNNWGNRSPFNLANTYPSRYVGPAAAIIYDYCYDKISPNLRGQLHTIFNIWFDSTRKEGGLAYENNSHSHGNHLGGHMVGIGLLGLATLGENPRAQHLIDWSRYRLDGTPSTLLESTDYPDSYRTQNFSDGVNTWVGSTYGVDASTKGTKVVTFAGGHNPQGWSYANSDFGNHQVDFSIALHTVIDVDVISPYIEWYKSSFNALKHSMLPKRFMIDPIGDWGGNNGIGFQIGYPSRLAYLLENTDIGPQVQYFVNEWAPTQHNYGAYANGLTIPGLRNWEALLYRDNSRQTSALNSSDSKNFSLVPTVNPNGSSQFKVNPYFMMRSSWDTSAVWASVQMGSSHNTDHQHFHAGHIHIVRGKDQVLISPSNYKVGIDGIGVSGDAAEYVEISAHKNTLFFDDWNVYRPKSAGRMGGQDGYGFDRPITNEMTDDYIYLRSDLSSAYNFIGWHNTLQTTIYLADTVNRQLEHFYRNYVYIPSAGKFVVFDQVKVKQSNHQNGPYEKHLRWHFANEPVISGNTVRQDKGNSRLWLTTLAPANPQYTKYYLWNTNPDNWTNDPNLSYMFKSKHWRVETRDPAKPLVQDFMTAMQVGPLNLSQPTTSEIVTNNNNMKGAKIAGNDEHVILFNNGSGVKPSGIVSTQYALPGSSFATHILCGMKHATKYAGTLINGVISIAENVNGNLESSSGGVLRFTPADLSTSKMADGNIIAGQNSLTSVLCYPNPANDRVTVQYMLHESGSVHCVVRDILGNTVESSIQDLEHGIQAFEIDTRQLSNGIYTIELRSNVERVEAKIVIHR
ncbi:MAG TPA: T9SS type A sorting domain-containing protein, partial [Candidatus Kapabacteria bacterium]|nr:T9SS type A sorting domain-containing protein [Candidatus Kapabacteria bacterium]